MIDPKLVLLLAAIYGGVWVGGKFVDGVHTARVKVEHVVKATGVKIGNRIKHLVGQ